MCSLTIQQSGNDSGFAEREGIISGRVEWVGWHRTHSPDDDRERKQAGQFRDALASRDGAGDAAE